MALQRSLIILVGPTMTCFGEKMMISIAAYVVSCPTCTKNLEWYLVEKLAGLANYNGY